LRHWEEAYRVDPLGGGDRALFLVPILLTQKRVAEALAAAQSLAAVAPETGDSSDTLASVYLAQGDNVAGLRQLRRTFEIEGNANRLIDTLSLMGQTDAAARWLDATKPGPRWAALIALRTGSTEALGDVVTPWLAASPRDPFPLGFYAFLLARRADEAFDRGDTAAQQVLLADAISAFRDVPFFDDRPGFHMDYFVSLQPRLRWLTVARQAGDEALATKLQSRLTKTMNEQFSPEEFSFERGLLAALAGDRSKAIDEFERAMVVGQWCLPGLEIFGVLQDRGGVFHGVAADPRFQQLVAGERARRIELNDRILAEAPDLLEPPKPSPNASVEAHGS
jgi:tetratricopeptide (TPR) repeat protein